MLFGFQNGVDSTLYGITTINVTAEKIVIIKRGIVTIQKFTDTAKYLTIIGTSNPKHRTRWKAFGGVG